jgi:hypothetical protein
MILEVVRLTMACAAVLVPLYSAAQTTSPDRRSVWEANKQKVVRLKVTGRAPDGQLAPPRSGSGVIIGASGTVVTAAHVVGEDAEWFMTPTGQIEREIEVFALDQNDIVRSLGKATSTRVPSHDLAILHLTAERLPEAKIDSKAPDPFGTAIAMIWDPAAARPDAVSADLQPTDTGHNGDVLTLRLAVIEGHSGSGVFGADSRLIGIITNKLDANRALAEPARFLIPYLPTELPARPSEEQVAVCEARARGQRIDQQPFMASNGVRCDNMGDAQSGIAEYTAPPNYTIIGQVQHRDETNYGAVGPIEYVTDKDRVVTARASIKCETPKRPFGPGGWAGTTLTGLIERVLSSAELVEIRQTCLTELAMPGN